MRPLLLVDVDGVISLFGFDHHSPPPGRYQLVDGITHFLSGTAGGHLRRLGEAYELAWCTGWEDKANDYLPLALGGVLWAAVASAGGGRTADRSAGAVRPPRPVRCGAARPPASLPERRR